MNHATGLRLAVDNDRSPDEEFSQTTENPMRVTRITQQTAVMRLEQAVQVTCMLDEQGMTTHFLIFGTGDHSLLVQSAFQDFALEILNG